MFELSVACKYLIPRWRQLSVSIISLVSTIVIALVVWLIVVFFSVKDGLENSWIEKIVALTAPIRVTPTDHYYHSYYYLVDTISAASDYTAKTLSEKRDASESDPYQSDFDEEIPSYWPSADRAADGSLKDPVKELYRVVQSLSSVQNLAISDYENALANLRLRILRNDGSINQQFLEQAAYIGSLDYSSSISRTLIAPLAADYDNIFHLLAVSSSNVQEESPKNIVPVEKTLLKKKMENFFHSIEITALQTPSEGWRIPKKLLPKHPQLQVALIVKNGFPKRIVIPQKTENLVPLIAKLKEEYKDVIAAEFNADTSVLLFNMHILPASAIPTYLEGNALLPASLITDSIDHADHPKKVKFNIDIALQGMNSNGTAAIENLRIGEAKLNQHSIKDIPLAQINSDGNISLPKQEKSSEPILLPKIFRDGGALIGDQGYLSYYSPTPTTVQEQRIPVFVAGFYDPGIMPIGNKYILADKYVTGLIRASHQAEDPLSQGINIRFDHLQDAARIKKELLNKLKDAGIAPYWHVETYQEYEFTKDLIQQLHSEKNLFSLISLVIIVVACSNIISMLVILVNNKKLEIGILRSMGATSGSIASIFGFCGVVMGAIGSLMGIIAAIFTLRYVNELVSFISRIQGYDLFNPVFYGNTLPSEMSMEALLFVFATTAFISLLAGIVPAIKASMMRPSTILRAE